jgi:hypothetical protein
VDYQSEESALEYGKVYRKMSNGKIEKDIQGLVTVGLEYFMKSNIFRRKNKAFFLSSSSYPSSFENDAEATQDTSE